MLDRGRLNRGRLGRTADVDGSNFGTFARRFVGAVGGGRGTHLPFLRIRLGDDAHGFGIFGGGAFFILE